MTGDSGSTSVRFTRSSTSRRTSGSAPAMSSRHERLCTAMGRALANCNRRETRLAERLLASRIIWKSRKAAWSFGTWRLPSSADAMMAVSMLLKSCAMPPARRPTLCMRCAAMAFDCMARCSVTSRAVTSRSRDEVVTGSWLSVSSTSMGSPAHVRTSRLSVTPPSDA